ncbi:uncharacterized protein Z518_03142 [Rhinocladiella mackenziei CBS 650.93]|uniref:Uncharacterized protein n=1 Tax=Rhinocladiella mackenziei CBS 650.93 TaxID=1442369 RepID=A0A0D2IYR5_9EURO|nr:uncharacterized protein Z518_03142 [Rhinocladiella mackenziei CBS 650.93]KIX08486.1 hypothetical protein Z518_03142 [Rhinocladiella mackenziei CBS 650.93]
MKFVRQYPRWRIHSRQQPCSVYLCRDISLSCTTYIVISGKHEPFVERAKRRLRDWFLDYDGNASFQGPLRDPYFVNRILCHESLREAESVIRDLRLRLYDQLDVVDTNADQPFDRASLRNVTNKLHKVSQDCESLYASAEMLHMVSENMLTARQRILEISPRIMTDSNVGDSLNYLKEAMKDDSAVMKVIAILTVIFLPPTFIAGFFGMAFFEMNPAGNFEASKKIWIFFATAGPLTVFTLSVWWFWWRWTDVVEMTKAAQGKSTITL